MTMSQSSPPGVSELFPVPGAQERLSQTILDSLAAAVYICDANGRLVQFNEAAVTLWGRRPVSGADSWCGSKRIFQTDGSPLPVEDWPVAIALREGRAVRGVELLLERPDGVRRRIMPHPQPLFDASGNLTGVINMVVDITEQREAQEARSLLAAIVDSSEDAIISKTLEGRITSWNAGAQRVFGYTASEIVGRSVCVLIPPDRMEEEDLILSRLRRGERVANFQTVRIAKDGRHLDISLTVSPVRAPSGELIGASKIARDISAERIAGAALRHSENQLRSVLAVLPLGVYSLDIDGRINFANRTMIDLWGREPDISTRYCGFVSALRPDGTRLQPCDFPIVRAIQKGESFRDVELLAERFDGVRFSLSVNIDPLRDEQGRVCGAINVVQEISERVAAREVLRNQRAELEAAVARRTAELEETHRRLRLSERLASLGTLSAGLGHDLGNLLIPINASLDSLAAAQLPESARADLEQISVAARYLKQLAEGLRLMSLDPAASRPESTDLGAWWADAERIVKNALRPGVALEVDIPPGISAGISRPALTQAVFNLVQNAGAAMKEQRGARVRISCRAEGDRVDIVVDDNGPGMSEEMIARCLEPFVTTRQHGAAMGLGLFIVAGIIRQVGGELRITSRLGEGTAFTLCLPAGCAPAPHRRARVDVRDPRTRALVAMEARRLGFEVVAGTEGDLDLLVSDTQSPAQGRPHARRVVLLSDSPSSLPGVVAIGSAPAPRAIREALAGPIPERVGENQSPERSVRPA